MITTIETTDLSIKSDLQLRKRKPLIILKDIFE
jgi:hypothetical protein